MKYVRIKLKDSDYEKLMWIKHRRNAPTTKIATWAFEYFLKNINVELFQDGKIPAIVDFDSHMEKLEKEGKISIKDWMVD